MQRQVQQSRQLPRQRAWTEQQAADPKPHVATVSGEAFAEAARAYIGTSFQHLGRNSRGLDCAGLVFAAARDCGVEVEDFTNYGPTPDPETVRREMFRRCDEVDWTEWEKPGRIAVLLHRDDGKPRHFAVTLGGGLAVHQESRARCISLPEHRQSIACVLRLKGVS